MAKTTETTLCSELVKMARLIMPWAVTFNHCDRATGGVPDISFTARRTMWCELKYADPKFDSPEVQEITMKRLYQRCGLAFYIIYSKQPQSVCIKTPAQFTVWPASRSELDCASFDHRAVLEWVAARIR